MTDVNRRAQPPVTSHYKYKSPQNNTDTDAYNIPSERIPEEEKEALENRERKKSYQGHLVVLQRQMNALREL